MFKNTLTLAVVALAMACDSDVAGTPNDYDSPPDFDAPDAARGTVVGQATGAAEGSFVTVFRVSSDGSTTAVSEPAQVEARGVYAASVVLTSESYNNLIVEVTSETGTHGRAFVDGTLTADGTLVADDIDGESTLEADVFVELVADGVIDMTADAGAMSSTTVEVFVTAESASSFDDQEDDLDLFADTVLSLMVGITGTA